MGVDTRVSHDERSGGGRACRLSERPVVSTPLSLVHLIGTRPQWPRSPPYEPPSQIYSHTLGIHSQKDFGIWGRLGYSPEVGIHWAGLHLAWRSQRLEEDAQRGG